jgi:putative multiple sugar transport system permease protein
VLGALIGAWQGCWVAFFGIPAFIVALAGMLVFRGVTLTVLGNQGIGPFPDAVRTLSNGFTDGYLGNIGLGALGGADLFSLLVGILAVAGVAVSQWRKRRGRQSYGQTVDPLPVFVLKILVPSVLLMALVVQLARFTNLPWVLVLPAALILGYTLVTTRAAERRGRRASRGR